MTLSEQHLSSADDDRVHAAAREKLFKAAFLPAGNGLIAACPRLRWIPDALLPVLDQYRKVRDDAERLMRGNLESGHLLVIDRHKIAAALAIAILDVTPLRLTGSLHAEVEGEQLANELLAFGAAIRILWIFANHDARQTGQAAANRPVFPPTQEGIRYEHQAARALRHARLHGKHSLDLPLLAHWMFYIERYWRRDLECSRLRA